MVRDRAYSTTLQCIAPVRAASVRVVESDSIVALCLCAFVCVRLAGYGVVLATLLAEESLDLQPRQFCGVMLRQFVEVHWDPTADGFEEPEIPEGDRAVLKKNLPSLLANKQSKIRTAAAQIMKAIAKADFPDRWPELLPGLISALRSDNPFLVQGALRTVELIAESTVEVVSELSVRFDTPSTTLCREAMR
jgi:hypothetical protein